MATKRILFKMFRIVGIPLRLLLFSLIAFSSFPFNIQTVSADAPIYYVDKTNGSCADTNLGTSPTLPFCTITKGASVVAAGETVKVLAGTYDETVTVPTSGSASSPITYSALAGVEVIGIDSTSGGNAFRIFNKSYIIVEGFNVTRTKDYGIYVSGSNHITISNNHVSYSGSPSDGFTKVGIYLTGTTNSTITGNTSDHNSADGIRLTTSSDNNLVSNNIAFANAEKWRRNATGIHVNGSSNNTLIHNITYANEDSGLQFYSSASNNIVVGNLSYGNGDHGIDNLNSPNNIVVGNTAQGNYTAGIQFEGSGTASSGATIMNNISVDNGINPVLGGQKSNIRVDASSVSGTTMDYNLVYLSGAGTSVIQWNGTNYATLVDFQAAGTGQEVHGIQADPLFVSPVAYATQPPNVVIGDYHIQAGSPAIDSAKADAPSQPTLDIDGNARADDPSVANSGTGTPNFVDRGAYEYQPEPSFTVTFVANGGSGTISPQVANVTTALTANTFSYTGYSFTGWNTQANGSGFAYADGADYAFDADITLYAQWSVLTDHTVTFVANGGSGTMSPQVANIPTALTANSFSYTGYSFTGWNTAANGSSTAYANGEIYAFDADITLYAQWSVLTDHTVTFVANGGSGTISPQVANIPTALTANTFSYTGYSFTGWNTAANGSSTAYANGEIYAFDADITLYAQWSALPDHTVTFVANGGSGTMSPQVANVTTALTANTFSYTGYTFTGWNTQANGSGFAYADGADYAFDADITLYAQWSALPDHTVTFVANGGSGTISPQVANVTTALTANTFSYTGYSFTGWNTQANGSGFAYADGADYAFDADITLYAQWSVLTDHTVTFVANGGSGTISPQVSQHSDGIDSQHLSYTGYSFTGWNTQANGSGFAYADGADYAFDADITLYAQWSVLPDHTVTFVANGGSGTMSPQVANVTTALTANTFSYTGYSFTGWNTQANGSGFAYADGADYAFDADITLYAQWSVLTDHAVTFVANGGSGTISPQVANIPTALTANTFSYTGYSFTGWNTQPMAQALAYANGGMYAFDADITLYAQWSALPDHTVTFVANGGSGTISPQVANIPTALTANTFSYTGYSFTGWNTAANGSSPAYANGAIYAFDADITLYAQWSALPNHTVTFVANGGSGTISPQVANITTALTANTFSYTGYSFTGWNTQANGSGFAYADGAIYAFDADITLYAQWSALPDHTVTFVANGGSGTIVHRSANGLTALTANSFTYTGYSFTGWNTQANGSGTPMLIKQYTLLMQTSPCTRSGQHYPITL